MASEHDYKCKECGKKITKDEWDLYQGLCFSCALKKEVSTQKEK